MVYIASSHNLSKEVTKKLKFLLMDIDEDVFFPESIGLIANSNEEMNYVSNTCSDKIRSSNILVAIYPFGISVSIEIGRFLEQQFTSTDKKLIILNNSNQTDNMLKKLRSEAMMMPHIYKIVNSPEELVLELKKLSNCTYKS